MYSFDENKIVFIDPYEESIIDSKFLDYSMVLQSSNSLYECINSKSIYVDGSNVSHHSFEIPRNLLTFNDLFTKRIASKERKLVDILEATQFIRMLPFKCAAGNFDHAKYFYLHSCNLLSKIFS
jgi:hypothetical protein